MNGKRKRLFLATAAAVLIGFGHSVLPVFAVDTAVFIPESSYLVDKAGTLTMKIDGGRRIRVKIEKHTLEGILPYYDTLLEKDGVYHFTLDSCDFNWDTQGYESSFTIKVIDEKDTACTYTLSDQIVIDPGFSYDISHTQYEWNLVSIEGDTQKVTAVSSETEAVENIWYGKTEVTMEYLPYTLGDVDGNGKIEVEDACKVLQYYAQKSAGLAPVFTDGTSVQAENIAFSAADVTKDNHIDVQDACLILKNYAVVSAGLDPIF